MDLCLLRRVCYSAVRRIRTEIPETASTVEAKRRTRKKSAEDPG